MSRKRLFLRIGSHESFFSTALRIQDWREDVRRDFDREIFGSKAWEAVSPGFVFWVRIGRAFFTVGLDKHLMQANASSVKLYLQVGRRSDPELALSAIQSGTQWR